MKKGSAAKACKEYYNPNEKEGKKNLSGSLLETYLLRNIPGNKKIAEELADNCEVNGYNLGEQIYKQGVLGAKSNYLFFVLSGSCNLFMNENFVAELKKGECIGEFPILDSGSKYAVTACSNDTETCIAKIAKGKIKEMAERHPEIWKNMAKMIAGRLTLSNEEKYGLKPNPKPLIFIGSSSESLDVANIIQEELSKDFSPVVWDQAPFKKLGNSFLECLEIAVNKYDYGIFVFSGGDIIKSRGKTNEITRDNVIFELGMFVGKLTRKKAYLIYARDKNIKILSDFDGITKASYNSKQKPLHAALAAACNQIRESIKAIENGKKRLKGY